MAIRAEATLIPTKAQTTLPPNHFSEALAAAQRATASAEGALNAKAATTYWYNMARFNLVKIRAPVKDARAYQLNILKPAADAVYEANKADITASMASIKASEAAADANEAKCAGDNQELANATATAQQEADNAAKAFSKAAECAAKAENIAFIIVIFSQNKIIFPYLKTTC